jgi:hypothetical protein
MGLTLFYSFICVQLKNEIYPFGRNDVTFAVSIYQVTHRHYECCKESHFFYNQYFILTKHLWNSIQKILLFPERWSKQY